MFDPLDDPVAIASISNDDSDSSVAATCLLAFVLAVFLSVAYGCLWLFSADGVRWRIEQLPDWASSGQEQAEYNTDRLLQQSLETERLFQQNLRIMTRGLREHEYMPDPARPTQDAEKRN